MSQVTESYLDNVVGAAIFDLNGLPQEYFATSENGNMNWAQTIFQALGLRSLLVASLHLKGFRHAVIAGTSYDAIVVRTRTCYVAVLVKHQNEPASDPTTDGLIAWMEDSQPGRLRQHPRFRLA